MDYIAICYTAFKSIRLCILDLKTNFVNVTLQEEEPWSEELHSAAELI